MSYHQLLPDNIVICLSRKFKYVIPPLLYAASLMCYAYTGVELPARVKRIVMGALAYLISPIEAIPDLSPIIGYTDDLGVLAYGLVMIAPYNKQVVRLAAGHNLHAWIGFTDESQLSKIDRLF
jgi:uncharacterized membrane protein YkvA (DUF1232 family)